MSQFSVEDERVGDEKIVVLVDAARQRRVRIACHGAALLNFEVPLGEGTHDLADGYRDAAAIEKRSGSRFAILCPFANRIAHARYVFDGETFDLQPDVRGDARGFRHGFLRDVDFVVQALGAGDDAATVTLASSAIRPRPGYPFAIDLALSFALTADGLTLEARMHNVGERAAPCFFGWHPYWRLGDGDIDQWELQLAADSLIKLDEDLVPVSGQAAFVPLGSAPDKDFHVWRRIGAVKLDQGYGPRKPDTGGRLRTRLRNPSNGLEIALWQERGVTHLFSGDTVSRPRQALAIEPMECMTNAFNRADCADAIRLEAGAERVFRCGVELGRSGA